MRVIAFKSKSLGRREVQQTLEVGIRVCIYGYRGFGIK